MPEQHRKSADAFKTELLTSHQRRKSFKEDLRRKNEALLVQLRGQNKSLKDELTKLKSDHIFDLERLNFLQGCIEVNNTRIVNLDASLEKLAGSILRGEKHLEWEPIPTRVVGGGGSVSANTSSTMAELLARLRIQKDTVQKSADNMTGNSSEPATSETDSTTGFEPHAPAVIQRPKEESTPVTFLDSNVAREENEHTSTAPSHNLGTARPRSSEHTLAQYSRARRLKIEEAEDLLVILHRDNASLERELEKYERYDRGRGHFDSEFRRKMTRDVIEANRKSVLMTQKYIEKLKNPSFLDTVSEWFGGL